MVLHILEMLHSKILFNDIFFLTQLGMRSGVIFTKNFFDLWNKK